MANESNSHYFHAEAHALAGRLELPFKEEIKKQAFVKLEGQLADLKEEERAQRNYFSQNAKNFRLEGIISYAAAHTQVSGHQSDKHENASVTLATSVVEDLNILNVVTADRVVAQISTTHFQGEGAPEVTFLGTHFENLRIARHSAIPLMRLDLCEQRPAGKDATHVDAETGLLAAIKGQYARLKAGLEKYPADVQQKMRLIHSSRSLPNQYYGFDLDSTETKQQFEKQRETAKAEVKAKKKVTQWDGIACSLVENIDLKEENIKGADGANVPIPPPARSFGHVIHIPHFGNVFLAELTVNHNSFHLTMIRVDMGCIAGGSANFGSCNVNGGHKPGGP
jgi:hypothetical protein